MIKRVLVTGGFGRVASSVIPQLINDGYLVTVFARRDNLNATYRKDVNVLIGDLSNYEDVYHAVKDVDIVCHLGALFPPLFFDEPQIIATNVMGTFNVLQAMKNSNGPKRIIFASSDAVYATGNSHDYYEQPLTEDMALWPINVYGVTKITNEIAIEKYSRIFGFSYVILRFFWSMRPDEMIRLMFEARNYMDDIVPEDKVGLQPNTIVSIQCEDGCKYYDHITDFRDIASSVHLAIKNEEVHNETLNIAAADRVDYSVESHRVAMSLGREFKSVRVKGLKNYIADITKARKLLGYVPKHSMSDMVDEAIQSQIHNSSKL